MNIQNINLSPSFGKITISDDKHTSDVLTNYGSQPEYKEHLKQSLERFTSSTEKVHKDIFIVGSGIHNIKALYSDQKSNKTAESQEINTVVNGLKDVTSEIWRGFLHFALK